MGIRFKCHACGHELHVKDFQAGKRSKCPACMIRFRIPQESAEVSIPLTEQTEPAVSTGGDSAVAIATKTSAIPVANSQVAAKPTVEAPSKPLPPSKSNAIPKAIQEAPEAAWYVQPPTGGQFGPAPGSIFVEWLGENRITRDSMVWREGWPEWQLASDVFADYFPGTHSVPQTREIEAPPLSNPQNAATPPNSSISAKTPSDKVELDTSSSALSTVERTRLAKKMKRRRNYTLMILLLAMVAIGLVVALVVVLMRK